MGKPTLTLDGSNDNVSSHEKFRVLCQYLKRYQEKLTTKAPQIEGAIKYDSKGRVVPQLDCNGEIIVDPSCLSEKFALAIDFRYFEQYLNKKGKKASAKDLVVSKDSFNDIYTMYKSIDR